MLLRILKGVALTTAVAAVSVVALGAAVAARRGERALVRMEDTGAAGAGSGPDE